MKHDERIHNLQEMEQTLQQLILQKQTFQAQIMEAESAQEEIKKSDTVYKFAGNILVLSKKDELEKELKEKNEVMTLRMNNIEKQEESLKEKISKARTELLDEMKKSQAKK